VVRLAVERPAGFVWGDVGARQHEAVPVAIQHAVQPAGPRRRPDEDEQLAGVDYFRGSLGQVTKS